MVWFIYQRQVFGIHEESLPGAFDGTIVTSIYGFVNTENDNFLTINIKTGFVYNLFIILFFRSWGYFVNRIPIILGLRFRLYIIYHI